MAIRGTCSILVSRLILDNPLTPGPSPPRGRREYALGLRASNELPSPPWGRGAGGEGVVLSTIAWDRTLSPRDPFWQEEYFDRYIRNQEHYWAAVEYIEMNPLKPACARVKKIGAFQALDGGVEAGSAGVPPAVCGLPSPQGPRSRRGCVNASRAAFTESGPHFLRGFGKGGASAPPIAPMRSFVFRSRHSLGMQAVPRSEGGKYPTDVVTAGLTPALSESS